MRWRRDLREWTPGRRSSLWTERWWAHRMMVPKDIHLLIPRARECVTCHGKRDSEDVIKDLLMTKSSSIIWVGLSSFPVAQMVKNMPAVQETQVWPLGQEDPLEKGMATHSTILAWRIPWTEEPDRLQSVESHSQTRLSNKHCLIPSISMGRRQEIQRNRQGDVVIEAVNTEGAGDPLLALITEGGASTEGIQEALEAGKGKETDSKDSRRNAGLWCLSFNPQTLIVDCQSPKL